MLTANAHRGTKHTSSMRERMVIPAGAWEFDERLPPDWVGLMGECFCGFRIEGRA